MTGRAKPHQLNKDDTAINKQYAQPNSIWEVISRFVRQKIVWTTVFDVTILLVIGANCIFIAMENPRAAEDAPLTKTLAVAEIVFTVIFTIEMLIKWIALGFCGKKEDIVYVDGKPTKKLYVGYFLSGWNVLDFVIVVSSFTVFFPDGATNTSSVRVLRVLRPLRTIAKIKELRILVSTILYSLRGLADVLLLLAFLFIIFAIVGVQLFKGKLRQRCYYDVNPNYGNPDSTNTDFATKYYVRLSTEGPPSIPSYSDACVDGVNGTLSADQAFFRPSEESECYITSADDAASSLTLYLDKDRFTTEGYYDDFVYYDKDGETVFCSTFNDVDGNCEDLEPTEHPYIPGIMMSASKCLRNHANPDAGITQFDNFFMAILQVFVTITLEGWVDIMYKVQDTTHWIAFLYFWVLTVVVAFFAMNLCLAVIEDVYSDTVENEDAENDSKEITEFVQEHLPELKSTQEQDKTDEGHPNSAETNARFTGNVDSQTRGLQKSGSFAGPQDHQMINQMSSYAISLSRPNEELELGTKKTGHIKNDPLQDAREELQSRQKIALRAIFIAHKDTDPYYLKIKDNKYLMWMRKISKSNNFNYFVLTIIVCNTVILAWNSPSTSDNIANVLEAINIVFTVFFTIEMCIKLLGLGVKGYLADNWNVFDALIVIVSDVELIVSLASGPGGNGGALSALRAFRLLRVLRLLGQFESLRIILGSVVTSFGDVAYLVLILLLFIFMFSTLGISFFAEPWYQYTEDNPEDDGFPLGRWKFDDIFMTCITVFQCITADAWNQVMFDCVTCFGRGAIVYFVTVVVFSNFIVLTLFVAILLSRMGSEDESKWTMEQSIHMAEQLNRNGDGLSDSDKANLDEVYPKETKALVSYKRKKIVDALERRSFKREQRRKRGRMKSNRDKTELEGKALGCFSTDNVIRRALHKVIKTKYFDLIIDVLILANCVFLMLEDPKESGDPIFETANIIFTVIFVLEMVVKCIALGLLPFPIMSKERWTMEKDEMSPIYQKFEAHVLRAIDHIDEKDPEVLVQGIPANLDPLLFHKKGVITRLNESTGGKTIVEWRTLKTIRFMFEAKGSKSQKQEQVLKAVYFLREPGVKTLKDFVHDNLRVKDEHGYAWCMWRETLRSTIDDETDRICRSHDMTNKLHNSYLSSKWNQLDGFVVLVSVLGAIIPDQKFLRALRAIRPLRIAVRIQQIKVILSALVRAFPAMLNVIIFCFSFWLVLAILGMEFFGGQFHSCFCDGEKMYYGSEWTFNNVTRVLQTRDDCEAPCEWGGEVFNFDNVFESIHTLFVLATMSGWNDTMYKGIDVNGIDVLPKEDNHKAYALYFVMIIIICAFFSLNLIISVVVDNFQRIKNEQDGSALMTEDQQKWVQTRRLVNRLGLKRSLTPPRQPWRMTVFTIVMHPFFEPLILGCIILNTLTMMFERYNAPDELMKVLEGLDTFYIVVFGIEAALKITAYGWKQYIRYAWNKFDFFIVIVGFISLFDLSGDASINVLRLCRIGRVLRLINKAKTLRTLFLTLMLSIPSLWNIGLLLVVVFFVYAIIGMHLFGNQDNMEEWGQTDDQANFQDFFKAFYTLFRVSTGDGWSDVYERYINDCDNPAEVKIYFVSFFVLGALVMVNLFIATILDSYNSEKEAIAREQELKTIKVWRAIWQEYDTTSRGILKAEDFIDILKCVPKPVGFLDEVAFKEQLRERTSLSAAGITGEDDFGRLSCLYAIKADPPDKDVLELLVQLKMFVEMKSLTDDPKNKVWCIDYEDALLSYATMLVGPEIDVDVGGSNNDEADQHLEFMPSAKWYAMTQKCEDKLEEVEAELERQGQQARMARYDIHVQEFSPPQHEDRADGYLDDGGPPNFRADTVGGIPADTLAADGLNTLRSHQHPQDSSGGRQPTAIEMTTKKS